MQKYLKTIVNRIGGSPSGNYANKIIQIENLNADMFQELLQLHQTNDKIFGFEQFTTAQQNKLYLFTHPSLKVEKYGVKTQTSLRNLRITEETNIAGYVIELYHPSFLPISTSDCSNSIVQYIQEQQEKINDSSILTQILICKQNKQWKRHAIDQYKSYLIGNDFPSDNKYLRGTQNKIIDILSQHIFSNEERSYISEVESKIMDKCYRIEIRIFVVGEHIPYFKQNIELKLEELNSYNCLQVNDVSDGDYLLNKAIYREFSPRSRMHTLSVGELSNIFGLECEKINAIEQPQEETIQTVINHSQQNLIDMLPIGKKKEREIDHSVIDNLEKAMKRVKVIKDQKIKTHNISQGATLQRVTIKIPSGINFSDIDKSHKNLKAELGYESFSIEQGEEPGTVSFIVPCSEREVVYLKELLENEEFLKFADEAVLPFIAGVDEIGNLQFSDLVLTPHLLVAGATGSGKSKFITQLILLLLILRKPSEMIMYLIDPKKVEFSLFNEFPHVKEVVTNMNEAENIFKSLVVEMEKRYEVFAKHGVKNLTSYNKKATDKKLPFVVCVVDEYADLVMTNPEVENYIERMGQKARGAGIHLIVATQKPSATIIGGSIKANMPSKISFKLDSSSDYRTVFGKGIGYHLLGQGDGVMRLDGQTKEFIRFQSPVITLDDEEEEKVYEKIKKAYKGEVVEGIEIVEELKEEPIDKLKRIIAISGETRISQLQKEMGVRINTVQDLMQQLVDEKWLIKHAAKSKGYELIASQEELEKWRLH
jgi:S-DNA-T family DNA segregation ATPase FtsK/SpoIIIE